MNEIAVRLDSIDDYFDNLIIKIQNKYNCDIDDTYYDVDNWPEEFKARFVLYNIDDSDVEDIKNIILDYCNKFKNININVEFDSNYTNDFIEVAYVFEIKANNENVGARTKVKVVKNKVAPPFKTAEFDLMYGEGISKAGTLIDIGTNMEIINKSGAWYSYNGERMGQGKEAAKQYLLDNPQIADEIDRIIRDTLAVGTEEIDVIGEEVTEEV